MEVSAATPSEFGWLSQRLGCSLSADASGIKAVDGNGCVRGMVVYDHWTPASCQVHMALESPAALRPLLRHAFRYPFQTRSTLVGLIPSHAKAGRKLMEHLGFRDAHRIPDGFDRGDDLHVFEMHKSECPWLGQEN